MRSQTVIPAHSTSRSTARASISATAPTLTCAARAAPSSSIASEISAASRIDAYRRTFRHATAVCAATTSSTPRSSASNVSPRGPETTIAPTASSSPSIGATMTDSPGISLARPSITARAAALSPTRAMSSSS